MAGYKEIKGFQVQTRTSDPAPYAQALADNPYAGVWSSGGNLNNAIVVDKYKILNPEGLRLDKEFVKHKTLDCIGDFYLLGMQLFGNIECFAPGHNLNQQLIREILKNKENYRIEEIIPENNNNNFLDLIDNNNTSQNITYVA